MAPSTDNHNHNHHHPAEHKDTKSRSSRSSRFKFESDQAPLELQRIEEEARRKRDEFRNRVRAIDDRIAKWTSKFTHELVDRGSANTKLLHQSIHMPLQQLFQESLHRFHTELTTPVFFQTDSNQHPQSDHTHTHTHTNNINNIKLSLPELETKRSTLEQEWHTFQHKTIFQQQTKHFVSLQRNLTEHMAPTLALESTKADKREGSLVRTFETIAASTERGLVEQTTLTMAELALLKQDYEQHCHSREKEATDFMTQIAEIRELVTKEALDRQKQDQVIVNRILHTQDLLQQHVLDTMNLTNKRQ